MSRKEAYPVYIKLEENKGSVFVPDLQVHEESENMKTMAVGMEYARILIENTVRETEAAGGEVKAPGTFKHDLENGEIFTYVDVNLDLVKPIKPKTDFGEIEKTQRESAWESKENVIEFFLGQKEMSVTLTQRKMINTVRELAKTYPDEVKILYENPDGSIFAKVPTSYLKFMKPKAGRTFTEEEKEKQLKILEEAREKRFGKAEENDLI